ncbi:MAG TPA: ECF-type sigma factor [Acidobacteriaceae bacterium]|nr:ECF-type sigma factor [Acidobacteriaceae bacterium]
MSRQWGGGLEMMGAEGRDSFDEQFSLVYEELRRLAANMLRREQNGKVTPTTLVHEVWLKLAHSPEIAETSPLHFRRIAARAMRQVLVEAARRRNATRRGSGPMLVTFDESVPGMNALSEPRDILALDSALDSLNRISERQAKLVEGRFFGGLEISELAVLLNVSEATVAREWRTARAWLAVEIRRSLGGESGAGGVDRQ